jgi:hypothetical protein
MAQMLLARPRRNQTILKHEGTKTRRKRMQKKNHGLRLLGSGSKKGTEARSPDCDFFRVTNLRSVRGN